MLSLLFQAAQVPPKKKSSDSMDASTCSDVRPTLIIMYLAMAQTENDPRCISDLGSDNRAYSTAVHKSLLRVSFCGCVIKPMFQHNVSSLGEILCCLDSRESICSRMTMCG